MKVVTGIEALLFKTVEKEFVSHHEFCNFAKIIIARTSKDPKSLEWLQSSDKEKTSLPTLSNFSNLTTVSQRYEFYRKVMQRYQKNVHFSKVFLNKLAKIYTE